MHFSTKSYLKSSRNHTAKHALNEFLAGLLTMKKAQGTEFMACGCGFFTGKIGYKSPLQLGLVEVHSKPPALYMPFRSCFLQ